MLEFQRPRNCQAIVSRQTSYESPSISRRDGTRYQLSVGRLSTTNNARVLQKYWVVAETTRGLRSINFH